MVFILSPEQAQVSIKMEKPIYYPGELIKGVIYIKIKTKDIAAGILYIKVIMIGILKVMWIRKSQLVRYI